MSSERLPPAAATTGASTSVSQPWWRRPVFAALALALLGFALRGATVLEYERAHPWAQTPVIDERAYDQWARAIAGGDWVGQEVFFQEPLYPYWLGGVYALAPESGRSLARWLQAALGGLAVALAHALALRAFGARAALAAGALLALYPPAWLLACLLLKENLFVPLMLALPLACAHARHARGAGSWFARCALAGVLCAAAALLRGNALLLLPLLALWPLYGARGSQSRVLGCAAVVLGAVLVLAPVALRNYAVGGVFALTTSGAGTNVYGGNNADNPYGRATEFDWVRGIPEHEAGDWEHEAERRTGRELDAGEVSRFWLGATWDSLRADPLLHARILWNKLRLTLGPYEVPDNHAFDWDARHLALLRAPIPGFALLGFLGLLGLACWCARARGALAPVAVDAANAARVDVRDASLLTHELAGLALAYLATVVLTVTSDRIRLPFAALIAPFAGAALVALPAALRGPQRLRVLACCALAGAFAWVPVFDREARALDLDKRDYNHLALLLARPERLDEAERLAHELVAKHPHTLRLQTALAEIELARSRELAQRAAPASERLALVQSALDRLQHVAQHPGGSPRERFRAQKLAGLHQLESGKWAAAERRLREALRFDPEDPEARLALANALYLLGQSGDEPARRYEECQRLLEALAEESAAPELEQRLAELRRVRAGA